jgi:multicomponent Na+:H+ antiporter subunit D
VTTDPEWPALIPAWCWRRRLLLPWLRGAARARQAACWRLPLAALWAVWQVPDGSAWQLHFLDYTLTPLAGDKLSRLFATIFALMALRRRPVRAAPAEPRGSARRLFLRRVGDRRRLGRRPDHGVRLLGADGHRLDAGAVERRHAAAYSASRATSVIHLLGGVVLFAGIAGHLARHRRRRLHAHGNARFGAHWLILAAS